MRDHEGYEIADGSRQPDHVDRLIDTCLNKQTPLLGARSFNPLSRCTNPDCINYSWHGEPKGNCTGSWNYREDGTVIE